MTGLGGRRVYLDWNATAPLRPEARAAMLEAMDVVGNPSSVHAEGRAAKAIVEKARGQVAALVGCEPDEVVFTSGATEGAATVLDHLECGRALAAPVEHDCIWLHRRRDLSIPVDRCGTIVVGDDFCTSIVPDLGAFDRIALQSANSETGVRQPIDRLSAEVRDALQAAKRSVGACGAIRILSDVVQSAGKAEIAVSRIEVDFALVSAHKLGGPKGVGAIYSRVGDIERQPLIEGGGQERNRRAGTENVIGIAGFGAAAEAARHDLEENVWDRVEKLRNILEERLASAARETIFFGQECPRLPNTSCFAVPGWKGETQVMALDLAGFAVSAGSACSSGKVQKASRVLLAMGYDEETASSAIRVSMGPATTEAEVMAFADAWEALYVRRRARAA